MDYLVINKETASKEKETVSLCVQTKIQFFLVRKNLNGTPRLAVNIAWNVDFSELLVLLP